MAKFNLRDRVRRIGEQEVRTVEDVRPGDETKYWIQLGNDFATRVWAKESELELVAPAAQPESSCGFYPSKPIMD